MSRTRLLKPGFFLNEELGRLPLDRLLFAGLWTIADREGRLEDRPVRIRAEVLPFDDVDIEAGLVRLDTAGFIRRYIVSQKLYICITKWHKHQHVHFREPASQLPEFTEESRLGLSLGLSPSASTSTSTSTSTSASKAYWPSPGPSPGSVHPASPAPRAVALGKSDVGFVEFWSLYPVRKQRARALAAWRKHGCAAFTAKVMATLARMQAEDAQWLAGYVPHAATWLNGGGWDDEPQAATKPRHQPTAADRQMAVIRRTDELFDRLIRGESDGPVGSEEAGEQPGSSLSPSLVGRASDPVGH
jgi:hypothetical protein